MSISANDLIVASTSLGELQSYGDDTWHNDLPSFANINSDVDDARNIARRKLEVISNYHGLDPAFIDDLFPQDQDQDNFSDLKRQMILGFIKFAGKLKIPDQKLDMLEGNQLSEKFNSLIDFVSSNIKKYFPHFMFMHLRKKSVLEKIKTELLAGKLKIDFEKTNDMPMKGYRSGDIPGPFEEIEFVPQVEDSNISILISNSNPPNQSSYIEFTDYIDDNASQLDISSEEARQIIEIYKAAFESHEAGAKN